MDILKKYYPSDGRAFSFCHVKLTDIKDDAIYIFDTNILLELYVALYKENLNNVKEVFLKLKEEKRLLIPARVAREFAKNKGKKIAEIFKKIKEVTQNVNNANFALDFYPLLDRNFDYTEARGIQRQINQQKEKLKILLDKISDYVKDWDWQDPVSKMYAEIFTDEIIIELDKVDSEIESELKQRLTYEIAPGYKDAKKTDNGVGDLIIWFTVVEIGKKYKSNIIFVTNDTTKGDWFHNEFKTGVYPKAELFEEFHKETDGKYIKIIDFNKFIDLFKLELQKSVFEEEKINPLKNPNQENVLEFDNIEDDKRELNEGMIIELEGFGKGKILTINERKEDESKIVTINFDEKGKKQFMLHLLKKYKICK